MPKLHPDRDWTAFTLAIGLSTAFNLIAFAIVYDAVVNDAAAGISENGAQVLMTWGTGIIGVLGGVLGYRARITQEQRPDQPDPSETTNAGPKREGLFD